MRELAAKHGFTAQTPAEAVQAAVSKANGAKGAGEANGTNGTNGANGAEAFLSELAHRVALGVASVCVVLDPGLVVLGGEVGRAGGAALADRVRQHLTLPPARGADRCPRRTRAARRDAGRGGPGPGCPVGLGGRPPIA